MPAFAAVFRDLKSLRMSWSQPVVFTGLDQRCPKQTSFNSAVFSPLSHRPSAKGEERRPVAT
jgi:hypothetical protein